MSATSLFDYTKKFKFLKFSDNFPRTSSTIVFKSNKLKNTIYFQLL